jgi:hypothetical protein
MMVSLLPPSVKLVDERIGNVVFLDSRFRGNEEGVDSRMTKSVNSIRSMNPDLSGIRLNLESFYF